MNPNSRHFTFFFSLIFLFAILVIPNWSKLVASPGKLVLMLVLVVVGAFMVTHFMSPRVKKDDDSADDKDKKP